MEFAQLQYFRTVARLQHMTRAAEVLHISQPALSRAIAKLEEDVGVPLFEHDGNRIRLTPYGSAFLERADRVLLELDSGLEELHRMSKSDYGDITLAAFTHGLLNSPIADFVESHPNIHFRHFVQSPNQMHAGLEQGKIDFAFSLLPVTAPDILWTPVMEDEFIVLVSNDNPLADKKQIDLVDLKNERLCLGSSGFGMTELVEGFCSRAGFTPRVLYEGSNGDLCMHFLQKNACVLLTPASVHVWKVLSDREVFPGGPGGKTMPSITALRIGNPDCRFQYGIASSKVHVQTDAAKEFYRTLLDYFDDWKRRWEGGALAEFLENN